MVVKLWCGCCDTEDRTARTAVKSVSNGGYFLVYFLIGPAFPIAPLFPKFRLPQERALGIVGTTVFSLFPLLPQLSLWCAGGNLSLLSHFLFYQFFSQKSPPIRRARTPDKHGAIEGAEFSWSSELLRAGVGLPKPNPRGHINQSAWFVGALKFFLKMAF
jgi:hypothetical protein